MSSTASERRPDRQEAWDLLCTYTSNKGLLQHALSVEAVMRFLAMETGGDPDEWGIIGLVHDLDWERFPDEHTSKTAEILAEAEWPESWIRAVRSHAYGMFSDVEPQTPLEQWLYTIDELTGLVKATALMRPSRSLDDLTPKSVKKKWKDKAFAAGVDRGVIEQGADRLGVEIPEVLDLTIRGMRPVGAQIGLERLPDADSGGTETEL